MRLFVKFGFLLSVMLLVVLGFSMNADAQCCLGQGSLAKRVVARVAQPVVNTVAFVAQNRPRPLARLRNVVQSVRPASYVQVASVASVSYVRVANSGCGCSNCACVDCACGTTAQTFVQAVPVLETRSVVYNTDECGVARVAPVATALRNVVTAVPRAIRNASAVCRANLINSNLFYVPVQESVPAPAPAPTPEQIPLADLTSADSSELLLASI